MPNTDHDLLIRLDTKVDNITTELVMMRDSTTARVTELNANKLDVAAFKLFVSRYEEESKKTDGRDIDYEGRLRRLEMRVWIAVGIIMTIQFLTPIMLRYFN